MPINNPNPINIPAIVADSLWVSSLVISAPSVTGKVSANAKIVPYSSTNGQMVPSATKTLYIPDVASAAADDANLATAITAIFAAVNSQVIAKNLFAPPPATPTPPA